MQKASVRQKQSLKRLRVAFLWGISSEYCFFHAKQLARTYPWAIPAQTAKPVMYENDTSYPW
jgi:hypothetical protein